MFHHPAWAEGSYSSGHQPGELTKSKSTQPGSPPDVSPCIYYLKFNSFIQCCSAAPSMFHFSYADAYNHEDPTCPHETGQTWGYWNGNYWATAGAGLAVRCTCAASSGSGKGASIKDVRKIFGFFDPPPCHCKKIS